ncbi:hypothetical protein BDV96DRAFT_47079 [Lophiotrema nucula]|uniref:Zn(2)-C6 fungal-type domain-containing protein n=1 Tax=Lophiotrema nucula TaxID=690887 RepID=A0A6A5ZCV6_9PLEO|nr:hypothetical protein BDV96DRAFT_47079 [Lophiotrema nucula]
MASSSSYPDPDAQMGGAGIYVSQHGTPPNQQQHMTSDAELRLQEHLAPQLQESSSLLHGGPQGHPMNPALSAHHQFQTPSRPTHSPQQMAQSVMSNLDEHNPYSDHDGSRKRSKVSRACDECRRKKIRCDATSENGPEACSSCKRTGARCQFSRQPMKRGPSKGYIKELADRLNSLESQIQNPNTPGQPYESWEQGLADLQTPTQFSRKRTHSMSEQFQDPYGRPNWSGVDREFSTNGAGQEFQQRPSYSDTTIAGSLMTGTNEAILKAYYTTIHPTLPILSHDSTLLSHLTGCPSKLRQAFFLALEASVRSFSASSLPPSDFSVGQLARRSSDAAEETEAALGNPEDLQQVYPKLVYCQTLLLLVLAYDKPGAGEFKSGKLLAQICSAISQFGFNNAQFLARIREQDQESFDMSRRLFMVTFILDRFRASSTAQDTVLPVITSPFSRDDLNASGEVAYHLARVADTVGRIAFQTRIGSMANVDASSPWAVIPYTISSPAYNLTDGALLRLRESLDISNLPPNSVPHIAHVYTRILISRLSTFVSAAEVLSQTKELLGLLLNSPSSPIHQVFAKLAAISLNELADRVETQVEAHTGIKELSDAIASGRIVPRAAEGSGWDASIQEILHQKQAPTPTSAREHASTGPNMALQHLAAAAVGERDSTDGPRPTSSNANGASELQPDIAAAIAAASEAAAAQVAQQTAAAAQQQMDAKLPSNGNNQEDAKAFAL